MIRSSANTSRKRGNAELQSHGLMQARGGAFATSSEEQLTRPQNEAQKERALHARATAAQKLNSREVPVNGLLLALRPFLREFPINGLLHALRAFYGDSQSLGCCMRCALFTAIPNQWVAACTTRPFTGIC